MDAPNGNPLFGANRPIANHEPAHGDELSPFFENIIDKKVNQVALNVFEWLMDKLCMFFYTAYREHSSFRLAQAVPHMGGIAQKVHHFIDGAPFYDRTSAKRVQIKPHKLFDLLSGKPVQGNDEILVDGKVVFFSDHNQVNELVWGKNHGTKEGFAVDVKECPELVLLYEREANGQLKAWCIDTTQPVKYRTKGGQLVIAETEVLIAEQIAPQRQKYPPLEKQII